MVGSTLQHMHSGKKEEKFTGKRNRKSIQYINSLITYFTRLHCTILRFCNQIQLISKWKI